jgi:hypothetical protein
MFLPDMGGIFLTFGEFIGNSGMRLRTKILIGILILAIGGGIYGYYQWNKPHLDIHDQDADFTTTVSDLAGEFQKDPKAADKKYHEKVVSFSGMVSKIDPTDSLTMLSLKGNDFCGVACEMLPGTNDAVAKIKVGDQVKVKAFYMGFMEGDADFGMPGDIFFKKGITVE